MSAKAGNATRAPAEASLWFLKLSDRAGFAQLVDEVAGNARVRFTCFGDDLVVLSEDEFAHTIIEKAS